MDVRIHLSGKTCYQFDLLINPLSYLLFCPALHSYVLSCIWKVHIIYPSY